MPMPRTFTSAGAFIAASLVCLVLAGCASEAPPAPLPVAVVPRGAVAPPPVALSGRVVEAAAEYRIYMDQAAKISPAFHNGPSIEEALTTAEGFEAQQLSRGAIAYGALVALQDAGFVAGVRTYAVDPDGRRAMAQRIAADPNYAAVLPGASSAAGLIIATLNADGTKVRTAGEMVKQSAYDVQHQAWSKGFVTDPAGRLAHAKSVSASSAPADPQALARLRDAVNGGDTKVASKVQLVSATPSAPPYSPLVTRALAVAALAALGEGGDDNDAQVSSLLNESNGGFCLNMSKLNLYQCLAVAKPWYEDIFCLGQHVLVDTGTCIAKGAGKPNPTQMAAEPTAGPAAPGANK